MANPNNWISTVQAIRKRRCHLGDCEIPKGTWHLRIQSGAGGGTNICEKCLLKWGKEIEKLNNERRNILP